MRGRFSIARLVALVCGLSIIAAACTGSGSSVNPSGTGSAQAPVTLQVWVYAGYEDVLPPAIAAFNKKYGPAITVQVTNIPEGSYPTKLDLAIAAHNTPDLAFPYDPKNIPVGDFLPLDSAFQKAGINLTSFNQGPIKNECTWNGQVYCIGNFLGADVMFYNKDLFTKAGVALPSSTQPMTVDGYVADACKIYHATGTWGTASGDPYTWLARDNYVTTNGQYAHLDTPTLVGAYTSLQTMYKDGCAPSPSAFDPWAQGSDIFAQGKIATVITDFRGVAKIEHAGINYGVAPVPVPPGGHPEVYTWTDNLGVVKYSAHPSQAITFLEFLATQGQLIAVQAAGDFPLNPQVAVQTHWATNSGRQQFLQVQKLANPEVFIPDIWNISGPVFDAFSNVLNGTPPKVALTNAQKSYQTNLDQSWSSYLQATGGRNPNQGITFEMSSGS